MVMHLQVQGAVSLHLKITGGSFQLVTTAESGVRCEIGDILNGTKEMPNAYILCLYF